MSVFDKSVLSHISRDHLSVCSSAHEELPIPNSGKSQGVSSFELDSSRESMKQIHFKWPNIS